ncbi:MAG: hypothetical protein ACYTFK_13955 [Planctomycetota bacterium]|jgi:hypothetical protein
MKPVFDYLSNLFSLVLAGICGKRFKKPLVDRADIGYATISYDEFHAALEHTHGLMNATGWDSSHYRLRALDCENYARKMAVEITKFIAENSDINDVGIPVGTFGYTRDDGAEHELVQVYIDGDKRMFFDIFPEPKYLTQKILSKGEIASCCFDVI